MSEIYHVHASPDCRTLSRADKGKTGYRLEDGSPNPHASPKHLTMVAEHDAALRAATQVMHEIAMKHPNTCLTIENPIGYFHMQPPVKSLIESGQGWQLKTTHYCKAANPKFDGNTHWSKKPTHILIKGGEADLELPQCNLDCPYRLAEDPTRHTTTIRIDNKSHASQTKVLGEQRHAIPAGLWDRINTSHMRMLQKPGEETGEAEDQIRQQQAPAGLFAVIDRSHECML